MEIIIWNKRTDDSILELDHLTSGRVVRSIKLLEKYGNLLEMPDSKSLGKGLFELRTQGKVKVRVLYIFHNNKAYLIHAFIKKTWKIPFKDISYARSVQKEIMRPSR
jgi:phage-related protein